MKKFHVLAVVGALALTVFARLALAADIGPIQTISLSSGSSSSVTIGPGQLSLQCDGEVRYKVCESGTCTATSTSAKIGVDAFVTPVDLPIPGNFTKLALIRTGSSTVTCYLYKVIPRQTNP